MIKKTIAFIVGAILLLFTLRRWLFTITALRLGEAPPVRDSEGAISLRPEPPAPRAGELPPTLLLVPVRNEEITLPDLLPLLARLDYPPNRLTIVLIDDGSTDNSRTIMERWIGDHPRRHLLTLAENRGKAEALNMALDRFEAGELIAIYDADDRPRPDALRRLVLHFDDPQVGAVTGRRAISNALSSPAAAYAACEVLVHQLITLRAKDRLRLAPAILGSNCVYRRSALVEVGRFKPGALLEDSDLTLKLARAGWQTRFEPASISYHPVPETIGGYWRIHTRWARGFNEVAGDQAPTILRDDRLSPLLRLELLAFAAGYLDRLALVIGGLLALNRSARLLRWVLALSLATPLAEIIAALKMGREPAAMWRRLIWTPFFFGLDMAMAAVGMWHTLRQSPPVWEERGRKQ